MTDIKAEKKRIRKEIKNQFRTIPISDFDAKSKKVLDKLKKLPEWKNAETVLIFLSLPDEIKTEGIINEALEENKKTAVPRINGNDIVFHYIKSVNSSLIIHPLGIAEPSPSTPVFNPLSADEKTLILVPGLAFDKNCFRLGRGKGFYDKFLSGIDKSVKKIGIGYDFQIVESVPAEDHDFPLDSVITDTSIF